MAGITHNVTLQAAQDALADALCELVEARAEVERLRPFEAEAADLRTKVQAAASVLLEFAGRLGVTDDELAEILAEAQMRAEDSAATAEPPSAGKGIGCSSEWFCRGHPKEYCPCRDRPWAVALAGEKEGGE